MTKITATALERKFETVDYKLVKRAIPIKAKPRVEMSCKECGRVHLVSVGQIKKCFHNKYTKSRRKMPKPIEHKN